MDASLDALPAHGSRGAARSWVGSRGATRPQTHDRRFPRCCVFAILPYRSLAPEGGFSRPAAPAAGRRPWRRGTTLMMPRRTIRATRSTLAAFVLAAAAAAFLAANALASGCRAPGESAAAARTAAAGGPLNLLLVTLDTVRSDHLGCYGDAAAETPHLDALARQGVRFARASSPVPL